MTDDYTIGVWDVSVDLNLSDESIINACKTDAPTCVMVLSCHSDGGESHANPHQSPTCRLCDMIELYAVEVLEARDVVSYSNPD